MAVVAPTEFRMTANNESESPRASASWHHFGQKVVGDPSVYVQLGSGAADMTRFYQGDLKQTLHHLWLAPASKPMGEPGTASYINEVVISQPHFAQGSVVITTNYDLALEKARRLFFTRRGESDGISAFDVTRLSNAVFVPPATANQVMYERHLNPADPAGLDALQIAFLKPISPQAGDDLGGVQPMRVFRTHGISAVLSDGGAAGAKREFMSLALGVESQRFEDGVLDPFSRSVGQYLIRYGRLGLAAIEQLRRSGKVGPRVFAQVLMLVSSRGDEATTSDVLGFLIRALDDSSPRVRDAAAAALAAVGTRDLIPAVEAALAKETNPGVRLSLEEVLAGIAA